MSLTSHDLQQIRIVVKEAIDESVETGSIHRQLVYIKKELRQLRKTIEVAVQVFDERLVAVSRRVQRLENHILID